jgi:phage tail-like protein
MPQTASANRAYSAAHFGLELGSGTAKDVGLLRSIEGGGVSAEVLSYQYGDNYDIWRQMGKPKYEDIKLQVGMSMSSDFYKWIYEFVSGKGTRKDGAIVAADFKYKERARREFSSAMITELAFPKLDGSDKNPAYMNVTMAPEKIEFKPGTNSDLRYTWDEKKQKMWTACNFSFVIDGYQQLLTRVTKVDGFSIKQKPIEYHVSEQRYPMKTAGRIEWPGITFYLPEADAKPLLDDFTARAGTADKLTKFGGLNGAIQTYDNAKTALIRIEFKGAQFKSATPDKSDASSEEMKLVKFELAIESMMFSYLEPAP